MHKSLIALVLVAGCGGSKPAGNQASPPAAVAAGQVPDAQAPERDGASATSLAGLYEGGRADRPNQLCMIERAGKTQFGLVVWGGANLNSCSGAGEVERTGEALTLRMTGDSACTIEAVMESGRISFRMASGPGCGNYYCGHGARFDGAAFSRKGSGPGAAKKALDIAGDPLCG